jgi:hypothetical protein
MGITARTHEIVSITLPDGIMTPGSHNIEFIADYYDELFETDEGNNSMIASFTWEEAVDSPFNLIAKSGYSIGSIYLEWSPPSDTTFLQNYIVSMEVSGGYEDIGYSYDPYITIPGFELNTNYCFRVYAEYYINGKYIWSMNSNTACIKLTGDDEPPTTPRLSITTPAYSSGDDLRLSWTQSTDDSREPIPLSPIYIQLQPHLSMEWQRHVR